MENKVVKYRTIVRKDKKTGIETEEKLRELDTKIFNDIQTQEIVSNFHKSTWRPDTNK